MAGTSTDYLLQQLLASNEQVNDNLSVMRDLLADNINNRRRSSNSSGNKKLSFGDAFKNITKDINGFGNTLLSSSADVGTVTNSLGTSMSGVAGTLGKAIPAIGGVTTAFQLVVEAGLAVYNYLNQQLEMYNKISSSGVDLAQGMSSIRDGSANALMSMDKFSASVIKNSVSVAQLDDIYGDGVKAYGDLLGSLQLAQDKIGLYGVSQEQMADLTSRNIKFQKQFGGAEMIRQTNQEKSSQMFIQNMTSFSKSMGESVDTILKKVQDFDNSLDARGLKAGLKNWIGLSDQAAAMTTKAFTEASAGMGDFGKNFMTVVSSKATLGALPDNLMSGTIAEIVDLNEQLMRQGVTDAKDIRNANLKWITAHKKVIEQDMQNQIQLGNTEAAMFDKQMLDLEAQATDPKNAPAQRLEQLTNKFNNWISTTFVKPFNLFFDAGVKWLLDISETTNSFNSFIGTVFDKGVDYLMNIVQDFFKNFAGISTIGKAIFGDAYNTLVDNVGGFVGDLIKFPITLISIVTDIWNGDLDSAKEAVQDTINSFKKHFFGFWDGIKNIKFSFSDIKDKLMEGFKALKEKFLKGFGILKYIFGDGDKPTDDVDTSNNDNENNGQNEPINTASNTTNQPEVTDNTRKQPQVEATPKITKPERVEEAQDNSNKQEEKQIAMNPPTQNYDESMVELLSRMTDALEQANQLNTQSANYLRTISDNTQAQRNS